MRDLADELWRTLTVVDTDSAGSSPSSAAGVNDASGRVRWRKDQTHWRQLGTEHTDRSVHIEVGSRWGRFTLMLVHSDVGSHWCWFTLRTVHIEVGSRWGQFTLRSVHIEVGSHWCWFTLMLVHIDVGSHWGRFTLRSVHVEVGSHWCWFTLMLVHIEVSSRWGQFTLRSVQTLIHTLRSTLHGNSRDDAWQECWYLIIEHEHKISKCDLGQPFLLSKRTGFFTV